jgi:hypothetical protein
MKLLLLTAIVLLINIPFGCWRKKVNKFSVQWFIAIHLPVILIVILRIYSGVGFAFITYPVLILAFITGQYLGGRFLVPCKA